MFTTCLMFNDIKHTNFELSRPVVVDVGLETWRGGGGGGGGETEARLAPCVDSKRLRVCIQNVRVCAGTHGDVLQVHTEALTYTRTNKDTYTLTQACTITCHAHTHSHFFSHVFLGSFCVFESFHHLIGYGLPFSFR